MPPDDRLRVSPYQCLRERSLLLVLLSMTVTSRTFKSKKFVLNP